jgi:hypothetical protein
VVATTDPEFLDASVGGGGSAASAGAMDNERSRQPDSKKAQVRVIYVVVTYKETSEDRSARILAQIADCAVVGRSHSGIGRG